MLEERVLLGSHKPIEMEKGSKWGQWTLLGFSHQRQDSGNMYFNVVCSCGTQSKVSGSNLRTGKSQKCVKCSGRKNGRKALDVMANRSKYFYAIRCGDYVKFGVSDNPERRLKDILSANPFTAELIWKEPNEEGLEKFYHNLYEHRHHRGEWFYFGGVCEL